MSQANEGKAFSEALLRRHLNEEPKHSDLVEKLSSIDNQWVVLGVALDLEKEQFDLLQDMESNKAKLSRVFQFWRKNLSPPYTWATILDIISGPVINNQHLCSAIEQFLGTEEVTEPSDGTVPQSSTQFDHSTGESMPFLEQNKLLLQDFAVDQMSDMLDKIGLGQFKETFEEMGVDGQELTEDYLKDPEEFNLRTKFRRDKVMKLVNGVTSVTDYIAQHVGEDPTNNPDSSSTSEIDQVCLDNAMKEGSVKSRVTKAVVQGEARAGKTSLKCLLLSQSYDKLSTGCIEAPSVAISQYGRTGKCWSLVKDEEMDEKVLSELHAIAENSYSLTLISKESSVQPVAAPVPSASANSKGLTDDELILQPIASHQASEKLNRREAIAKVKDLYEQCKRVREKEGLSFHEEWLYFIDSGGQLQFQKLLPAFMPFASVLTLVLNVANNLSDPASTEMQLQDKQISVSEHSPTVEEILKQLLSAIASSTEKFNSLIARDRILSKCIVPPAEQLNVIAVATHCDEYNELVKKGKVETLQVKEAKLKEIFDSVKSKCTILRGSPPQYNILHEVDGCKAKRDEFDDPVVEQIAEKLQTQAYEIKVPIKWYCFHVLLRKIAKEGCGVLSLAYCEALGQELGMSREEVRSALKFFHVLNMLLYYPDSPVSDMAFIQLNSLVDIIGELVVLVCTARQNWGAAEDDVQELATKGLLSVEVLRKCSKYLEVSKVFHKFGTNLLGLFEHLLIAVCLPAERGKFFMPALLPVKDVSKANPFPNRTPLLFSFDNAVPMGLFCAFIVQLLSLRPNLSNKGDSHTSDYESSSLSSEDDEISKSSGNPWQIIRREDLNWSNCFTLQNSDTNTTFDLVEMLDCIEVHAEYPDPQVAISMEKAIKTTIETWRLNEKIKKAFYCNCPVGGGIKHKAIVSRDKVTHKRVLQCKKSGAFGDLNDEQTCWLKVKANKEKRTFSLQQRWKEEPKHRDLLIHLKPTKHKWKEIGIQLGLEECDLQAAGQETSDELRLGSVMQFWKRKDSPELPYTWGTILDIIGNRIGDKDLCNRIEQELGTEKVDTTKQTNVPATSDSDINVSSGATETGVAVNKRKKPHNAKSENETIDKRFIEPAKFDPAKLKTDNQERKESASANDLPSHLLAASVDSTAATATQQVAACQPKLLVADNDLLRCSRYLKEHDIRKLIGLLDDDTGYLQGVSQKYETDQEKAYWILKKWLIANPETTRDALKEKLELMGFSKAAKNLLPPEEQKSNCEIM